MPDPSIVAEMFGDTMLANGTVYPEATVEARRYRLRVLNACQARFLNLQLFVDDGSPDGITLNRNTMKPTNAKGPDFLVQPVSGSFGRAYEDPATETPKAGATEVWQIANLTGDTHPIHFHLVNVQVLGRQPFNADTYNGTPSYTGSARGPDKTELGWKETVRMNPEEVTTVIMKFDLPQVPFAVPSSLRTSGNEYVWHCHILEHEEHDMMRPLVVS